MMKSEWADAVIQALDQADGPMTNADIAGWIVANGAVGGRGGPRESVNAYLRKLVDKEDSPIRQVRRGVYALRHYSEPSSGAVQAFGMYWHRSDVDWNGSPKLLGRLTPYSEVVDQSSQVGVYLLYDRERVIYVGRTNSGLVSRLAVHTTGRFRGRWDRFSWFGLKPVNDDGTLAGSSGRWSDAKIIDTLEAVLIEAFEPPQNRRRGDTISDVEYLQVSQAIEADRLRHGIARQAAG